MVCSISKYIYSLFVQLAEILSDTTHQTSNKLCVLHIMMDWAGEPKIQKPKEAKIIKQGAGMAEDGKF